MNKCTTHKEPDCYPKNKKHLSDVIRAFFYSLVIPVLNALSVLISVY